jgi:hypothetical protein
MAQRQLKAEVDRSQQLASKPSSSAKTLPNGILGDHNINALKLYEDLTNLMITGCKSEIDPDTGHSQLVYQCICTGAQSGVGESKGLSRLVVEERAQSNTLLSRQLCIACILSAARGQRTRAGQD